MPDPRRGPRAGPRRPSRRDRAALEPGAAPSHDRAATETRYAGKTDSACVTR